MVTPNAATDTGDFLGGNTLLHQANAEFAEFNSYNMATFPIHPALMQGWIQSNPQESMSQNPDIWQSSIKILNTVSMLVLAFYVVLII